MKVCSYYTKLTSNSNFFYTPNMPKSKLTKKSERKKEKRKICV